MRKYYPIMFLIIIINTSCLSIEDDIFINDNILNEEEYAERVDTFIGEGFGCQFTDRHVFGHHIMSRFGEILYITKNTNMVNQSYVTIGFSSIEVDLYYKEALDLFDNNALNHESFKDLGVGSIDAKNNTNYLYNVNFNMNFQDFINTFGVNESSKRGTSSCLFFPEEFSIEELKIKNDEFVIIMVPSINVNNHNRKYTLVRFKENKISYIRWVF